MKTLLVFLAMALTGCATVGVTRLGQAEPRNKKCSLDVFTNESEVKRQYQNVCLIDSKTGSTLGDNRTMAGAIDIIRPEACKCGADAIVLMGGRSEGMNFWSNGQGFATVKAIKYND